MEQVPHVQLLATNDARVQIGRYSYGNPKLFLWNESDRIKIGSFCSIADEVAVFGGGEHRSDWLTTYPLRIAFDLEGGGTDGHPQSKGVTRIGNDVWIGYRSTVLSGVAIGDGAIIGAGAVVTKDIEPYAVVAGNPAKVIRKRFPADVVDQLLRIEWWDWPLEEILAHVDILCSPRHEDLVRLAANRFRGNT